MDLQLKGKRALVTGASKGLGFATARILAQEGCQVAINSRSTESLSKAAQTLADETGSKVISLPGDVIAHDMAGKLVQQTVEGLGGLDILITNSGGPPAGKFESFDDATWQDAVELNLLSHVRLIRAALPSLRKSQAASVLTIVVIVHISDLQERRRFLLAGPGERQYTETS